jgi:hypothetical protein
MFGGDVDAEVAATIKQKNNTGKFCIFSLLDERHPNQSIPKHTPAFVLYIYSPRFD